MIQVHCTTRIRGLQIAKNEKEEREEEKINKDLWARAKFFRRDFHLIRNFFIFQKAS